MKRTRWGRIIAIAIGIWFALWILSGDREPEAQAVRHLLTPYNPNLRAQTESRHLETITRGFPIAGDTCRAPGFVVTDGVVLQTPDLAEFFYAGELTLSAPPGSVTIMVLNSLARDGRRFRIIAVPIEVK